ncbi:MAG: CapA family protein [SAR324 cluster bacterium]|nr:CapA family protein [SAR324 cluster bacterium]
MNIVAVGQSLIKRDLMNDPNIEFKKVLEKTRAADLSFTNYEGTILGDHGGWSMKDTFSHASAPSVLDTLKAMGFNALALSNNHAFDLGPSGILSTLEEVEKRGFLYAGIGTNKTRAAQPHYLETSKGRVALLAMDCGPQPDCFYARDADAFTTDRPGINRQRVIESLKLSLPDLETLRAISRQTGFDKRQAEYRRVGFRRESPAEEFYGIPVEAGEETIEQRQLDQDDLERNLSAIEEASSHADFVIVYVHHHYWSPVWEETPAWIQNFARQCIDCGGNIFVSHGVPLLQGIEIYKRRPIFYSLGNFIFHSFRKSTYSRDSLWESVIATCSFEDNGELNGMKLDPVVLGGSEALLNHALSRDTPQMAGPESGKKILDSLAQMSMCYNTQINIQEGKGYLIIE